MQIQQRIQELEARVTALEEELEKVSEQTNDQGEYIECLEANVAELEGREA